MYFSPLVAAAIAVPAVLACDSCYGPTDFVKHDRVVRRMQPTAQNASYGPSRELDWGQINFLHTTDTHGWLEGHIKEENYGADWGDFVSFTRAMKNKASKLGVDLLLIDTGDLHDGNGDSDVTSPNGVVSNTIFENIEYDLMTIGNHELYVTDIAYETYSNFSQYYGDRYLTSNVQIINPSTGEYEYIGSQYRYFSTENGLRIMAFGVIFDFTGNSNVSKVTKAADLVKEDWFLAAVNYTKPIDLFVVIGHNPIRSSSSTSSFGTLYETIRTMRPDVPLQAFGGHTHIRDFYVYDSMTTGLESGRYCETLGWLSITGINSTTYTGNALPSGVSLPSTPAIKNATATATATAGLPVYTNATSSSSGLLYSRRYLDWNRFTFAYHAEGSQDATFDTDKGLVVSEDITELRTSKNLTSLYGCAPQTWCQSCQPFGADGNIFSLLETALATIVVNESRADIPRFIIINTGSVRFDLAEGPFTLDDSFIVSPFHDGFEFIPDVPYDLASQVLGILNAGAYQKRSPLSAEYNYAPFNGHPELCVDPTIGNIVGSHSDSELKARNAKRSTRGIVRRTDLVPGYTTSDDFGTDGDDTPHTEIAYYDQPNDLQANASFPTNGSLPATVDLIFLDYIGEDYVLPALSSLGANYTADDIIYYLPEEFTTNDYLPAYAKVASEWQANMPNCPVGKGIGFSKR